MPQMAPLWWEILFLLFNVLFFINLIFIYFTYQPKMNNNKIDKSSHNLTWKW